jgi:hypothetical protein
MPIDEIGDRSEPPAGLLQGALPSRPLLGLDSVPGLEVESLADPFLVGYEGRLLLFAEVLGRRPGTGLTKKIGVFAVADDLRQAEWLGEACPGDDGLASFPHVVRDGSRFLLTPEVFVPFEGAAGRHFQVLQIWETPASSFPFGWRKIHEGRLEGCSTPSDKVLLRRGDQWWLFCSDNAARQLLAYRSIDLRTWRPHPGNPVVSRDDQNAPPHASEPCRPRPWRLGGSPLLAGGQLALPLQHSLPGGGYGGAVTLLHLGALDDSRIETALEAGPILAADPRRPWMAVGAHHLSLVRHADRIVVATDGYDGTHWTIALVERPDGLDLVPVS